MFAPGGAAQNFLTQVTLATTSASNELVTFQDSANAPGSPSFNGRATIYLGQLGAVDQLSGPVAALVARLSATPPDLAVQKFAVEFFARLLASYIIRTTCTLVLGPATGGPSGTFAEKTGFDLPQNAAPAQPSSYVDLGIEAMRLRPETIKILEDRFPVAPLFK
jgi:hypothetical protein